METNSQNIIALLGPTNTGKTYVAIEKMLEYSTGIFGLPLRLLARDVYDKCIDKVGVDKVALLTGEEMVPQLPGEDGVRVGERVQPVATGTHTGTRATDGAPR